MKRLALLLIVVFVANLATGSAGASVLRDWIEHEKNHVLHTMDDVHDSLDLSGPTPPADPERHHDCHASHHYQAHVTSSPVPPRVSASRPEPHPFSGLIPPGSADLPFRPPRASLI